jgi:hypothetical protein
LGEEMPRSSPTDGAITTTRRWTALATGLATLLAACALLACIPAVASADTIVKEGAITADDPDQTGRVSRSDPASTCAAPTPVSQLGSDLHNYDAYTFTNHSSSAQCITVELDPKACVTGGAGADPLQSVAYSSFDPTNVTSNYLADIGMFPDTLNTPKSYSFTVPAGGSFVVVVHTTSTNATCAGYKLTVSSPGALAATIVNEGAITADDPDQTGRVFRDDPQSTCAAPTTVAPAAGTDPRNYDAYSFTNVSSSAQCITVELDPKTCEQTKFLQSVAYSSFDPTNPTSNYLGDIGSNPAANTPKSYSFTVPAGASFVVVVHTSASNETCAGYKLTVSFPGAPNPPSQGQQQPATGAGTGTGTGTGTTGGVGSTGPGKVLLAVTGLTADNRVFRVDPQGQVAQRGRRVLRGTRFRFSLSAAARVNFAIERRTAGRRVGRRCRRQTRRNRNRRRCVRYVAVRRFARQGQSGQNVVPFSGRIRVRGRARSLRPGRYRATLGAVDGAGNRSALVRVAFRVVP